MQEGICGGCVGGKGKKSWADGGQRQADGVGINKVNIAPGSATVIPAAPAAATVVATARPAAVAVIVVAMVVVAVPVVIEVIEGGGDERQVVPGVTVPVVAGV